MVSDFTLQLTFIKSSSEFQLHENMYRPPFPSYTRLGRDFLHILESKQHIATSSTQKPRGQVTIFYKDRQE